MLKYVIQNCFRIVRIPYVSLEITSKCNSRCKTCNVWKMQTKSNNQGKNELTRDEIYKIIIQLRKLGCQSIELHGGEPTLRKDLPELVAFSNQQSIATIFATNGLNMSEELASDLVGAGLNEIRFSLDGPRETHNLIRGRDDAFERQMRTIEAIHGADEDDRVTKIINTTISSMNIQTVEETVSIARQKKIKYMLVFLASVIEPKVAEQTNKIFQEEVTYTRSLLDCDLLIRDAGLIKRKREQLLRRSKEENVRINNSTFFTMPISQVIRGIKRLPGPCSRFYWALTIDPFGNVFPCEYIRYKLGNVRDNCLKEILSNGRFKQFSRLYSENVHKLPICNFCCHSL